MVDFLQAVTKMYTDNMVNTFNRLIEQNIPCAYFSTFSPNEVEKGVESLLSYNINLQAIYTVNDTFTGNVGNIPILYLTEDSLTKQSFNVMLIDHWEVTGAYSTLFESKGYYTLGISHLEIANEALQKMFKHLEDYYRTYSCFIDQESRKSFLGVLVGNATARIADYHFVAEPQYFLDGFYPRKGDIVIDGGAFDGGTAKDFTSLGGKVYAFEMDRDNFFRCQEMANKYGFTAENMGLWNDEKYASYTPGQAGSSINDNGTEDAYFTSIDIYVKKNNLPRVDYIKLDVEGAELDVLHGAVKSIVKYHPTMAISAYHKAEDMWQLRDYISAICPRYEFAYRHYKIDVHDYMLNDIWRNEFRRMGMELYVPTHWEHVLYCRYRS